MPETENGTASGSLKELTQVWQGNTHTHAHSFESITKTFIHSA